MAPKAEKKPMEHPPYVEMVTVAIKSLKERNGSSGQAIKKYIGANYKLPAGWEKTLSVQLKRLAASSKLVKVKASYKLSEELKATASKSTKKPVAKKEKPATEKKVTKKPKAEKTEVAKKVKKVKKAPKEAKKSSAKKAKATKPASAAKPAKTSVKKTTATKKATPAKKAAPKAKKMSAKKEAKAA